MHSRLWRLLNMLVVVVLALAGMSSVLLAAPAPKMDPDDRDKAVYAVGQVGAVLSGQAVSTNSLGDDITTTISGDMAIYTAAGVSLSAPVNWEVTASEDDIFTLGLPGEFVFGFLSKESADEFPGIFAIVFFEQQSELLAASMGEDVVLQEFLRFETDQGLPGLMIRFGGEMSGLDMAGSMYIVAAGDTTYMLILLAEDEIWADLQEEADAMAVSIVAENPSKLISGGADGLTYTTADGTATLELPPNWQVQEIEDEDIPVILVNPEMTFVAAGLWEPIDTIADATDLALYNALLSAVAGSETEAEVMDLLIQSMDMGSGQDELVIDQAATALFDTADPPVLRLGATMTTDEMTMPLMAYVQARQDGVVGLIAMGNMDDALDAEETILAILASVVLQLEQ